MTESVFDLRQKGKYPQKIFGELNVQPSFLEVLAESYSDQRVNKETLGS
jgi:hypothetical protein